MEKRYCATCANRRSPLCDLCTQIHFPDGTTRKPSYYIMFEGSIPDKEERKLEGRAEECASLLECCIRGGSPLPLVVVMEYNGHIECMREE